MVMSTAFRHLIACLLLVLLPLQVMAATFVASEKPAVPCAQATMADMDCCDDDTGGDCAPVDCLGIAAMTAMPAAHVQAGAVADRVAAHGAAPPHPDSHIPDGLQRPPRAPV